VDWIGVALDRDTWRDIMHAVMHFQAPKILENYEVVKEPVASRLVLSSLELVS
jgi:hypothetical protein